MADTTVPASPRDPWSQRYAVRVKAVRDPAPVVITINIARIAEQQKIWESNKSRGFA
jgi:hypothetical protein